MVYREWAKIALQRWGVSAALTLFFVLWLTLVGATWSSASPSRQPSASLPRLLKVESLQLKSDISIPIILDPAPDTKLNSNALSWLALYREKGKGEFELIKEYKGDDLSLNRPISLPALKDRSQYRLQATFYSCTTTGALSCRVESRDMEIKAESAQTAKTQLKIQIDNPG